MNISGASISTTFNFLLFGSRSRHALPLSSKATKFLMLFLESHPPSSSSISSSTNRVVAHQHGCRLTSDVRQDAISKSPLFRPGIRLFLLLEEQVTSWRKKSQDTPNWKSLRRAPNLFLSFSFGCKFVLGQWWLPFLFYFFMKETERRSGEELSVAQPSQDLMFSPSSSTSHGSHQYSSHLSRTDCPGSVIAQSLGPSAVKPFAKSRIIPESATYVPTGIINFFRRRKNPLAIKCWYMENGNCTNAFRGW